MRATLVLVFLLICTGVIADSPAKPTLKITASGSGAFIFKLHPGVNNAKGATIREPFGIAYEVKENGDLQELWRVEGWYAFKTFLSNDGRYLVRMGDWAIGKAPSKHNLAVAFYDKGKLVAEYSTADLVKDKTKVFVSTSHYMWLAHEVASIRPNRTIMGQQPLPYLDSENFFHLKTCDGISYKFDVRTGDFTGERAY